MRPRSIALVFALSIAGSVVAGCAQQGNDDQGACASAYLASTATYAGSCSADDGWSDAGDDSSSSNSDDNSSAGDDSSSNDDGSSGDGDDSDDGSDDTGDDSGDDSSDARPARGHHTSPRPVIEKAIAQQSSTATPDQDGCYACALTCVVAKAPPGLPNEATAVGASDTDYATACNSAETQLGSFAYSEGTTLQACRTGAS